MFVGVELEVLGAAGGTEVKVLGATKVLTVYEGHRSWPQSFG